MYRSLYPIEGRAIFPPNVYIGIDSLVYLFGGLIGTTIGFFIIKLLLIGVKEELNLKK